MRTITNGRVRAWGYVTAFSRAIFRAANQYFQHWRDRWS